MTARERILGRIGRALEGHTPVSRPEHVGRAAPAGDLVEAFCAALEAAGAGWEAVARRADLPAAVAAYRERAGLAGGVTVAPVLRELDWPAQLAVEFGTTDGGAELAVSEAAAGIAETGTLVLPSAPGTPTLLNFLPDHQMVALARARVVDSLEAGWAVLGPVPPRVVNFVTGPSRTADVEQTIQIGAHGPRSLYVLLID